MSPVVIRDVTLRDGLQSLPQVLATTDKLDLLDRLMEAGLKDFQVTSFMNPARLPQTGDAEAVFAASRHRQAAFNVLVGNMRGFQRALAAGARSIDAVVSVSDSYNRKNVARGTEDGAAEIETMLARAPRGCTVGVDLANCFHCFMEGEIAVEKVVALVKRFHAAGVERVWISDTTGHAVPEAVTRVSESCLALGVPLGLHLHDTLGRAGDNLMAGYRAGLCHFDAALSGLGGSPFTPGVGGNLSLETLAAVFAGNGIAPGFDVNELEPARASLERGLKNADGAAA